MIDGIVTVADADSLPLRADRACARRPLTRALLLTFDPSYLSSGRMSTKASGSDRDALLQGTLDLRVLRIVLLGARLVESIARALGSELARG